MVVQCCYHKMPINTGVVFALATPELIVLLAFLPSRLSAKLNFIEAYCIFKSINLSMYLFFELEILAQFLHQ
jgi:hypothetical protein